MQFHALACCCLKVDSEIFLLLVMQKRRERINERLKVLQNLVPNGTKASLYQWLETKKRTRNSFFER